MIHQKLNTIMKSVCGDLNAYGDLLESAKAFSGIAKDNGFKIINSCFMMPDAHTYYAIIKKFSPKRIIEIGAGNSTIVASLSSSEIGTEIIAIDPSNYSQEKVSGAERVNFIKSNLEDVDLSVFDSLEANDILFIDSSHIFKEYNDLCVELINILPKLKSGVLIHFHDIYLPNLYSDFYSDANSLSFNEQTILLSIILNSNRFKIIWPGAYLHYNHNIMESFDEYSEMKSVYPLAVPSSFWVEVI